MTKAEIKKKRFAELIEAIECNTEDEWQEKNITKALFEYLNVIEHEPEFFRYGI